jgi:hypothetical protein
VLERGGYFHLDLDISMAKTQDVKTHPPLPLNQENVGGFFRTQGSPFLMV